MYHDEFDEVHEQVDDYDYYYYVQGIAVWVDWSWSKVFSTSFFHRLTRQHGFAQAFVFRETSGFDAHI